MKVDNIDEFIDKHMPFVIKCVSDFTNRYVEMENSEELSIALEAFHQAIQTYQEDKGSFFSFARKVIHNKLVDYTRKNSKVVVLELKDQEYTTTFEENTILKHELEYYESVLLTYGISFEQLISKGPKHQETRKKIFALAKAISQKREFVQVLLNKNRLPITDISREYHISKRVIKSHKIMLMAVTLAYHNNIHCVIKWVENI